MIGVTLAEKIERLRCGRSNAELAAACGCSTANMQKIIREGSQPNFALGSRLAKELDVAPDWLADDAADWPPPASKTLPDDERDLLGAYRALDRVSRASARGWIIGLAAYEGNEDKAATVAQALREAARRETERAAQDPPIEKAG